MSFRLGEQGYANAEIEPVPELNHENKEAEITFYVDPKSRVYVRRINFHGVDEVDDEVLRERCGKWRARIFPISLSNDRRFDCSDCRM